MKKNNISIINEIIMILQNHIEYNTTEFITTHCINNDGSIDYDIKFTLEDSDKEEKEQTNIVKFGDVPEEVIPTVDDCVCYDVSPDIEDDKPIKKAVKKKGWQKCGNCIHFVADKEVCNKIPEKAVYSTKTINIDDCFESI